MPVDLLQLCVCPECSGELEPLDVSTSSQDLVCPSCRFIYPAVDDIPILMPPSARNYELEYPAVLAISHGAGLDALRTASIRNTISLLESRQGSTSWEWEDEAYWSSHYVQQLESNDEKNWNDRLWERKPLILQLMDESGTLRAKSLLDIGCGEGQTFAKLIAPYCEEDTIYVATDVSLEGLRLNRRLNPHHNSAFVLCTASRLPFADSSFDILCYWGILHHTEGKAQTLPADSRLIRDGGYLLLHEALIRPTVRGALGLARDDESAHEERIDSIELLKSVESSPNLSVLSARLYHTPFYTLAFWGRMGGWVTRKQARFALVERIDRVLGRLGKIIPFFRPGSVLMLVKHTARPQEQI